MCTSICKSIEKCFCCCGCNTEREPSSTFNKNRSCTDILFLLFFIASIVGVIICISTASNAGADPYRTVYGVDYSGRICGRSAGVEDKPLAIWPDPSTFNFKTCVDSCDKTLDTDYVVAAYETEDYFHYCIPKDPSSVNGAPDLLSKFQSTSELASRAIGDLLTTWPVLVGSFFLALIIAWLYSISSRAFVTLFVWGGIFLILAGGAIFGITLLNDAAEATSTEVTDRATAMRVVGIIVIVCTVISLLLVIFLRNRIRIAIEIYKEAGRAVEEMPSLTLFPLGPTFVGAGYFVFFIAVSLYIFSVKTSTDVATPSAITSIPQYSSITTYKSFQFKDSFKRSWAYVFFQMLWTMQFLSYFSYLVVAGAIANWYFSNRDASGKKKRGNGDNELEPNPVAASVWRTIRYHLGTVAIGALIIAVIQAIRAVVKYAEMQMNKIQGQSRVRTVLFCLLQCCLYCLQCCMDKINKNAYVWTAIWGDSFAPAVCNSFSLIWNNLFRVAAINMVGVYMLFLGKLVVALLTTGICSLIMKAYGLDKLNSPVVPLVVIFIIAYMVASIFMVIFDTTIDTVFLCFLVDEKINKGSGNMYASDDLVKIVEAHSKDSKQEADRQHQIADNRKKMLEEN